MAPDVAARGEPQPVLELLGLTTVVETPLGPAPVVDGVSLAIHRGRTLGLVGESGCGKSMTALSILGLLPALARVTAGQVRFEGRDLVGLRHEAMRPLRGGRIAMVFQEPMSALNPVMTVGAQVEEAVRLHQGMDAGPARQAALAELRRVGIAAAESRLDEYPHRLSGGMRQRVVLAMALAGRPQLLIADEPTTALDVTVQAQVLALLAEVQAERGMAILLVTHDLGVVARLAHEVAVMYLGRIVERAEVGRLLERPQHPYTQGLLASLPGEAPVRARLHAIPGQVPPPSAMPSGCRFRDRCPIAEPACATAEPALVEVAPAHRVACWLRAPSSAAGSASA